MTLYWLKHGCSIRALGYMFGINEPYASLHHTLLAMLSVLGPREIRWPTEEQYSLQDSKLFAPYSAAVGAIDGTYTTCGRAAGCYSGHRKRFVRTAQCVIDSVGYFILVVSGISGSRHDSAGVKLSSLGTGKVRLAPGVFLLSDKGYKDLPDLNAPTDPGVRPGDPGVAQTFTNWRTRIEHTFSRLKNHFGICERKWFAPAGFRLQAEAFTLACALYNRKLRLGMFAAY
jgi:DDE superfamily endonuclease